MNQQRRKFADYFALACGALAIVAWFMGSEPTALAAIGTGGAVLIWSLVTG